MAQDLAPLVDPAHTALLTMEMQRAVTGDLAMMTDLRDLMIAEGTIDNIAAAVRAARDAGAQVVHCTAETRADGKGRKNNARILAATAKMAGGLAPGEPGADVIPEIGVAATDIVVPRLHGLTPFTSTSLDQILRNMEVRTVVITGNSVNIGVLGAVISAVDLGYQVVVPSDAVAGIPTEYAAAVLVNTIGLLATITTTEALVAAWG